MLSHGAVASRHLGKPLVEPILRSDWQTLDLAPRLAGVLRFLELLALRPLELGERDVAAAIASGASRDHLQQASAICASFSFMNRFVDVFGADLPPECIDRVSFVLDKGFGLLVRSDRDKPWSRLADELAAAKQRALDEIRRGSGDAPADLRESIEARVAAHGGAERQAAGPLPPEVETFVDTIARHAPDIDDSHFAALVEANWSEPAIYEMTFVACVAAGWCRLERAWALLGRA